MNVNFNWSDKEPPFEKLGKSVVELNGQEYLIESVVTDNIIITMPDGFNMLNVYGNFCQVLGRVKNIQGKFLRAEGHILEKEEMKIKWKEEFEGVVKLLTENLDKCVESYLVSPKLKLV